MINLVSSPLLRDELLRLASLDRDWVQWHHATVNHDGKEYAGYQLKITQPTWVKSLVVTGADGLSMFAVSIAMVDGIKIFRPTPEQCEALAQIEVGLELSEYAQPYPSLVVELPEPIGPFVRVVCHHCTSPCNSGPILTCVIQTNILIDDITTTVSVDGRPIEQSLQMYDEDCKEDSQHAVKALRIAINSCLIMMHHDIKDEYLHPKEVERDERIVRKKAGSEAARHARHRLLMAPRLISFKQEVVIHDTDKRTRSNHPSEYEVTSHWRRGHWAMQAYGPGWSLRKRILRKPVLVRADKFFGDKADTEVVYKKKVL